MLNRKIKLFLITLVFMLSISAVCAADNNITDELAGEDVDEEPPSGSVLQSSTNNSVISTQNENSYTLSAEDVNTYYHSGSNYEVRVSDGDKGVNNASVTITIDGVDYTRITDESGRASLPINLNTGSYVVTAHYGNYSILYHINVLPIIIGKDVVKTYKSPTQYSATFLKTDGTPLANTNVKFSVNGKTYTKKTNSKGVASVDLDLKVGNYQIQAIHPNGYKIYNTVTVKTSVETSNLNKHYKSSKKFSAKFYGKNGKVLAKKKVKFKYRGKYYTKTTNKNGVASIAISEKVGTYKIISINPQTGEKKTNTVKVSSTLSASKMVVFTGKTSTFKVKLYKNDKLVKNAKVKVYIKGVKKTVKTDSEGVASVKFKLSQGTYTFKSVDPYTGYKINTKVYVKLASLKSNDVVAKEHTDSAFKVTLLKQNGKVASNTKMEVTIDGVKHTVRTNSKGVASVSFNLDEGVHNVVSKDLNTGYTVSNKITVLEDSKVKSFNQYGVSEDGKTLLAIGRASASGEMSKYGYSFYQTEFLRICPYCGSSELYWSIFWAGSETADYGVFPATGHKEGGSAEGHIFCAHCDCDWSVFGHNHGSTGGDLTIVTKTISSSKEAAYALKTGTYVVKA